MPETQPPKAQRVLPRFCYDIGTGWFARGLRDGRVAFARGRLEVLSGALLTASQALTLNTHSQIKSTVPGVLLFDLSEEEVAALDEMKGVSTGIYLRGTIKVFDVQEQRIRYAWAYIKPHKKWRRS